MMENAGRNLAVAGRDFFLSGNPEGRRVSIMCGTGGNGGGGLVAARRLIGWGAEVTVWLTKKPDEYTRVPAHQLDILCKLDADIRVADGTPTLQADLILDAIIGYSLSGPPRGTAADLIQAASAQRRRYDDRPGSRARRAGGSDPYAGAPESGPADRRGPSERRGSLPCRHRRTARPLRATVARAGGRPDLRHSGDHPRLVRRA